MGHYPREETAHCLSDVTTVILDEKEFIGIISKNIDLLLKILKILSKELRDVARKVNDILGGKVISPFEGLLSYGQYYLQEGKGEKAVYFLELLKKQFPDFAERNGIDSLILQAKSNAEEAEDSTVSVSEMGDGLPKGSIFENEQESENSKEYVSVFYAGMNCFKNEQYDESIEKYTLVIKDSQVSDEYKIKAMFEIGRALFQLKKYDNSVNIYKKILNEFKEIPILKDVLYEMAITLLKLNQKDKAMALCKKIIDIQPSDQVTTKAKRLLSELK